MHEPIPAFNNAATTGNLHPSDLARPSVTSSGWTLRTVTTNDEFDELEDEWNRLTAESTCTVFQQFTWLRTWWKHFEHRGRNRLHIVVIALHGNTVGIAPLYVECTKLFGIFRFTRVVFLGRKTSDYLDIIARSGFEDEVAELCIRYLHALRHTWSCVLLEDIPDDSPTRSSIEAIADRVGLHAEVRISSWCPKVSLPASWQSYLNQHPRKTRHEFRRRERWLVGNFDAQFETIADESEFDRAFDDFIALHQQRWNTRGEPGVFGRDACRRFHREAARQMFLQGLVRLNFLQIHGVRMAGSYGFVHGSTYALYLLGMANAGQAEKYSPGLTLCSYSVRQAIDEGCRVFDFMRGRENYKYTFLAHDHANWTLTLYRHRRPFVYLMQFIKWLSVLAETLADRMYKERWRLRGVQERHGTLSMASAICVLKSAISLVSDAVKKLRQPTQPGAGDRGERRGRTKPCCVADQHLVHTNEN